MAKFLTTVAFFLTNTIEADTQEEANQKAIEGADKLLEVSSITPEVTSCEEIPSFKILQEDKQESIVRTETYVIELEDGRKVNYKEYLNEKGRSQDLRCYWESTGEELDGEGEEGEIIEMIQDFFDRRDKTSK